MAFQLRTSTELCYNSYGVRTLHQSYLFINLSLKLTSLSFQVNSVRPRQHTQERCQYQMYQMRKRKRRRIWAPWGRGYRPFEVNRGPPQLAYISLSLCIYTGTHKRVDNTGLLLTDDRLGVSKTIAYCLLQNNEKWRRLLYPAIFMLLAEINSCIRWSDTACGLCDLLADNSILMIGQWLGD